MTGVYRLCRFLYMSLLLTYNYIIQIINTNITGGISNLDGHFVAICLIV